MVDTSTVQLAALSVSLLAGLALFLFGMEQLSASLKVIAGEQLKELLARLTTNRFKAVFAGAFVTSVIQSSSVTTVLVVSFISAGVMTFEQSIGIIMGANIGTTVTAQIIAFRVTAYANLLIAAGFALMFFARSERGRLSGQLLMGLGLVFFGMGMMSDATLPLRDIPGSLELLRHLDNVVVALLISAVFTGIVQSSSATTGVVIVLAGQGWLSLEMAIALALGANVGTCITALLAAIGRPSEAVKASLVHVTFNVLGVVVWLPLIGELAELSRLMTPDVAADMTASLPRQIANAHTVFNVANTMLLIWFVKPLGRLVNWMMPRARQLAPELRIAGLDKIIEHTPGVALDVIRNEVGHLGGRTLAMLRHSLTPVIEGSEAEVQALRSRDDEIDRLHGDLVLVLGRMSRQSLSAEQSRRLQIELAAANYFENIGDLIETTLCDIGLDRIRHHVRVGHDTRSLLDKLHSQVCDAVEEALRAFVNHDSERADRVIALKADIARLADTAESHLLHRLTADRPQRVATFRLETDLIEGLRRLYYFAKRIAKLAMLDALAEDANGTPASGDTPVTGGLTDTPAGGEAGEPGSSGSPDTSGSVEQPPPA